MAGRNIQYVKQDEPSFIKNFKKNVGYVEGPDIDTKKQIEIPNFDEEDDDSAEKEDEKPVVVVLKQGDLTADQADTLTREKEHTTDDGKIKFKKPAKRTVGTELKVTSSKKKKDEETKPSDTKKGSSSKKVKNTKLLSFGDDEEEED